MIKAEDVFKVIDSKARYLTKDKDGKVYFHEKEPVCINQDEVWAQCEKIQEKKKYWASTGVLSWIGNIEIEEFKGKDWTDCIIKNSQPNENMIGCVGWFWDNREPENEKDMLGILQEYDRYSKFPYKCERGSSFNNFRPATKDELKFYGER